MQRIAVELRRAVDLLTEAPTEVAGHAWTIRTQTMSALGHAQRGDPVAARSALVRATHRSGDEGML